MSMTSSTGAANSVTHHQFCWSYIQCIKVKNGVHCATASVNSDNSISHSMVAVGGAHGDGVKFVLLVVTIVI